MNASTTILPPFSRIPRTPARVFFSFLLLATLSAWSRDASEVMTEIKSDPSGRYIAVANKAGELGILDLRGEGAFVVYTRHLAQGFNWSPDGTTLAYVERIPGRAAQLVILKPLTRETPREVSEGSDWKSQPCWLAPNRILYRSDRESDHVNVWSVAWKAGETTGSLTFETKKLFDMGGDITGLWTHPLEGRVVFSALADHANELWLWEEKGEPIRLTHDTEPTLRYEENVAFSPSGSMMVYTQYGTTGIEATLYDLAIREVKATIPLPSRPISTMVQSGELIVFDINSALRKWEPGRRLGGKLSEPHLWNGVGLDFPTRLTDKEMAAAINRQVIVTGRSPERLPQGKLHAARVEDLLNLAVKMHESGQGREAQSLLATLWEDTPSSSSAGLSIAATLAWLPPLRFRSTSPDPWLERTIALADPASEEAVSAWNLRLLLAAFEERDRKKARRVLESLSPEASQNPLVEWTRTLLQDSNRKSLDRWSAIVRNLRRKRWAKCADELFTAATSKTDSSLHREGVALLLRGAFEPINDVNETSGGPHPELAKEPLFQRAMLELAGRDLSPDFSKGDLRSMLLLHWARGLQLEAARNLALIDLSDPEGSSLDYADNLSRYLIAEEQDQWVDRALGGVLLSPRLSYLLSRQMSETRDHLVLTLARAKHALIGGKWRESVSAQKASEKDSPADSLDLALKQLDEDLAIIPSDFWNDDTARLLYLTRLYKTKQYEASRKWDHTRAGYEQCVETMNRFPGDWEIIPFDLGAAQALLDAGESDPDGLGLMLATIRALGDPLINPPYAPDVVSVGLVNLKTMQKQYPAPSPFQPFLTHLLGVCLALSGQPYDAVAKFREARAMNPPTGLHARILMEEAATRNLLGQRRLCADLLATLCELPLNHPQRAAAIKARVQAEREAGLAPDADTRLRELAMQYALPREWTATLVDDTIGVPAHEGEPAAP